MKRQTLGILVQLALTLGGCSARETAPPAPSQPIVLRLTLPGDLIIDRVDYVISGGPTFNQRSGSVSVEHASLLQFRIGNLPIGADYDIALSANTRDNRLCSASKSFALSAARTSPLAISLVCADGTGPLDDKGDLTVSVDVTVDAGIVCPVITGLSALPLETAVGGMIALQGFVSSQAGVSFLWQGGRFDTPTSPTTNYTCVRPGLGNPTLTLSKPGCPASSQRVEVTCTDAACADCLDRSCGRFTGDFDAFALCTANPDPLFTQLCVDAYECSLAASDRCADDLSRGPVSCYCGLSRGLDACFQPPSASTGPIGVCVPQWEAATGCAAGELTCVASRFVDSDYPSGMANAALICTSFDCAETCR